MIKIGLTGGIASGKSLICELFLEKGIKVLDSDKIYKNLLKNNKILYNEIKDEFKVFDLDFKKLGDIVFNDTSKLKKLNQITHPYVLKEIEKQLDELKQKEKIIVMDIPLLFEAKMESYCDTIICVYVDICVQKKRLIARNSLSEYDAIKRIESQMPLIDKCVKSDYVIDNSGTILNTVTQFQEIFERIREVYNVF